MEPGTPSLSTSTRSIRQDEHHRPAKSKPKLKGTANPLQAGIRTFLASCTNSDPLLIPPSLTIQELPKRYTLYPPLLLLPSNFTCNSTPWRDFYTSLTSTQQHDLFQTLARSFSPTTVSHIAISASISSEDVVRRPTGLIPVHGNFGPYHLLNGRTEPGQEDFERAFWVSTVQHPPIVQTWAPRWTMFSRGNTVEKARILNGPFPRLDSGEDELGRLDVLDLYVGIGYFAFSYLARGVRRVWGFDLNAFSIEGLRRGCEANSWGCLVLHLNEAAGDIDSQGMEGLVSALITGKVVTGQELRCVAFHGDNRFAGRVLGMVAERCRERGMSQLRDIVHVNLGLLPTSRDGWETAVHLLNSQGEKGREGWLHIHETVHDQALETKKEEIVKKIEEIVFREKEKDEHRRGCRDRTDVECVHVARVKAVGPGVRHFVFDVKISQTRTNY